MTKNTSEEIRNKLLSLVKVLPESQLEELYDFLLTLDKKKSRKSRIMSFAGAWADLDNEAFEYILSSPQRRSSKRDRRKGL